MEFPFGPLEMLCMWEDWRERPESRWDRWEHLNNHQPVFPPIHNAPPQSPIMPLPTHSIHLWAPIFLMLLRSSLGNTETSSICLCSQTSQSSRRDVPRCISWPDSVTNAVGIPGSTGLCQQHFSYMLMDSSAFARREEEKEEGWHEHGAAQPQKRQWVGLKPRTYGGLRQRLPVGSRARPLILTIGSQR